MEAVGMHGNAVKYLQQRQTRRYLTADGGWTDQPERALTILNVTDALDYCRRFKLCEMDIVLKFGREEYDVRLEVSD